MIEAGKLHLPAIQRWGPDHNTSDSTQNRSHPGGARHDLFVEHGPPDHIRSDNGPEFAAKAVQGWLGQVGVKTLFIEPGSPWENGYNESFKGKLRDELLDREIFCTLNEAKVLIERWRRHYNTVRPHSALGYRPPAPQTILPRPAGPAYAPLRHAQPGAPWHGPPLS